MSEKVLMKGNEAIAEAAIRCGCRHYFGYPITPQTEIAAYMAKRMPKIGGTFLQAESEIAAINMVYGAACTGRRAMTSSSSPGISLKAEGISYLAGADLPALIVNVQRGGPGLGGIQPSQSDYFFATRGPGHGDFHVIVLAPASVQEMADLTRCAFELAEKYRMPAMLLADGTMGQMMEPVVLPEEAVDPDDVMKGKTWTTTGTGMKRPHNIVNSLYLKPDELEKTNLERFKRYERLAAEETRWEEYMMDDAEICVVSVGITARVSKNAIVECRRRGVKVGMIRPITLYPFPSAPIEAAAAKVRCFLTVELNMGQMSEDVALAEKCARPVRKCNRVGGMIPSADEVAAAIDRIAKEGR
ncbi:MAG: 3-methyl-2-oxobutanoate dehydrogenase subunit VorB [Kiritimatiellae bacterium]|nr:3-methyl-2-oxobutanoate dehydrogenase subunit VorB [Kiritimatiellia bacterium]